MNDTDSRPLPRRLTFIALVTVCAIALAIAALTVPPAMPISRKRAIEIGTLAYRIPHLVLVGEPRAVRAQLVTLGEADNRQRLGCDPEHAVMAW